MLPLSLSQMRTLGAAGPLAPFTTVLYVFVYLYLERRSSLGLCVVSSFLLSLFLPLPRIVYYTRNQNM